MAGHAMFKNKHLLRLVDAFDRLADYLDNEKFEVIVLPGTTATFLRAFIQNYYREKGSKGPRIVSLGRLGNILTKEAILNKDLEKRVKQFKDRKTLILDDAADSGSSLMINHRNLAKLGFKNIQTGTVLANRNLEHFYKPHFIGLKVGLADFNYLAEMGHGIRRDLFNLTQKYRQKRRLREEDELINAVRLHTRARVKVFMKDFGLMGRQTAWKSMPRH